jgi:periplasmic protein TonB
MAPTRLPDRTDLPPRNAPEEPPTDDIVDASALAPVEALPRRGRKPKATRPADDGSSESAAAEAPAVGEISDRKPRRNARLAVAGALPLAHIPAEALVSPRRVGLVGIAFGVSVVLHAIVLAIHFSPLDVTKFADKEPPLEVALVNAKSATKPTKADILAQANLDGGGNTDQNRRAKTPLPVPKNTPAKDMSAAAKRVETLHEQRAELLTALKSAPVAAPQPAPVETTERTESPTANELMQKTLEAIKLEAQIAKDMDAYQKRPKRTFIGARAAEYRFARYVEDWRLKIERIGNLNYPEAARQAKLYGSLLLTVSIKADGTLDNVEVNRSSGQRILDAAAVKIVEMSGPFAPFPPDIKRDTDILHITRTWTFAKGDELTSH